MVWEGRFKFHFRHLMNVTKINHVKVMIKVSHIDMVKQFFTHMMRADTIQLLVDDSPLQFIE
jgi:hypothetical protein